ncbi:hypothetical protein BMS3Abin17_00135 [archaeon BMS3Abin17]|nr:hypothetical protein BMS3Abin17_00135 [archaeon BMS3Abin17]HDZ60283.1 hypothetical protein [Candidatus Pacearchaeota archaeon]
MVYKKYIKRGGKLYGPYYYKSIKQNGKVITEYVGPCKETKSMKKKSSLKKFFKTFFISLPIIVLVIALFSLPLNQINEKQDNQNSNLGLIINNLKKKIIKVEVLGLDITQFWEQKPPEDRVIDTLVEQCTVAYYQGCGGAEAILD